MNATSTLVRTLAPEPALETDAPITGRSMPAATIQAALEHLAQIAMARAKAGEEVVRTTIVADPVKGFDLTVNVYPLPHGEPRCIFWGTGDAAGTLRSIDLGGALRAMDQEVSGRKAFFAEIGADKRREQVGVLQAAE